MKIQYWSDIHLEFTENAKYIMQRRFDAVGDILVLAGDITYWSEQYFAHPFFDKVSDKFKKVYMIPGNHEFYGGFDISILENPVKINIRDNIYLVNNITETIDGVDFFFTALWSKIKTQNVRNIEHGVNDFHLIKYHGKTLTANDFNEFFLQSFHFLDIGLRDSASKKKVIVTHHCPTQMANDQEFWGSPISNAFVVDLYDFIYQNSIDYWIFGHTHRNVPEVNINGSKVICNQLGYVNMGEHLTFKMDACISI